MAATYLRNDGRKNWVRYRWSHVRCLLPSHPSQVSLPIVSGLYDVRCTVYGCDMPRKFLFSTIDHGTAGVGITNRDSTWQIAEKLRQAYFLCSFALFRTFLLHGLVRRSHQIMSLLFDKPNVFPACCIVNIIIKSHQNGNSKCGAIEWYPR